MKSQKNLRIQVIPKLIFVLPFLLFTMLALTSCATRKKTASTEYSKAVKDSKGRELNEEEPFVVVEQMPEFPGGDEALLKYIADNTKYPEASKTAKIQGKVIIRFCVTKKGTVDRISVLTKVAPDIDTEAMRVVSTLPAFKPGQQGGKDVPVWYMVPITFALK
jgi:TonB family protein